MLAEKLFPDGGGDEGYAGLQSQGGGTIYSPRTAWMGYDYKNHMVEYFDLDWQKLHLYSYDVFGRRIQKSVGAAEDTEREYAVVTRYINGGPPGSARWQVLEEQDKEGDTLATYVYGNYVDEVLTMRRGGSNYYYHQDDLFSVIAVTDEAGDVVESYVYGDYGAPMNLTGGSAIGNPYLFQGREWDPETEFYHVRTRYLEPGWGRFTSRDWIGVWGDQGNTGNAVVLTASAPSGYLDPFGLEKWAWHEGWGTALYNLTFGVHPDDNPYSAPASDTAEPRVTTYDDAVEAAFADHEMMRARFDHLRDGIAATANLSVEALEQALLINVPGPEDVVLAGTMITARFGVSRLGVAGRLAKNLGSRPAGKVAHHLVPVGDDRALHALERLEEFGIDWDDAANGMWLDERLHRIVHTRAYLDYLNALLLRARSKREVIEALDHARETLRNAERARRDCP